MRNQLTKEMINWPKNLTLGCSGKRSLNYHKGVFISPTYLLHTENLLWLPDIATCKKKSFSFSFFTNSKWKKRSQGMRIKERVKSTIWQKFILLSSQRRGRCLTVHSIIWQHWQWFVTLSVSCIPPLKIWWNLLNYCKFC